MHVTSIVISNPENFWAMVLDVTRSVKRKIKKKKKNSPTGTFTGTLEASQNWLLASAPDHSARVGLHFQDLLPPQNYSSFSNVESSTKIPNPFSNWTATLKHVRVRLIWTRTKVLACNQVLGPCNLWENSKNQRLVDQEPHSGI